MIKRLFERRVPQLTGLYIVASWSFVEFIDWAVDEYALSPFLTNFVVTTLLLLLPMFVVLAWRHGTPGEDRWTKTDAALIGINLVAAGGVLMIAFSGQELGAATTVRLIEDDQGNTVERVIPKAAFRRDVLLYPRASCLRKLERWDAAETGITELLEPNPGNAQYRLEAARLYAAQGRRPDAIAELEAALAIWSEADPEFRPAQEARALMEELQRGT